MTFTTYSAAIAYIEAESLPSCMIEVFDIAWVNGSPHITYFVALP